MPKKNITVSFYLFSYSSFQSGPLLFQTASRSFLNIYGQPGSHLLRNNYYLKVICQNFIKASLFINHSFISP